MTTCRWGFAKPSKPHDVRVFARGNPSQPDRHRPPTGFPTFFDPDGAAVSIDGERSSHLADAIVDADNPLTARVFVNRVWGSLMGSPLVSTPSDFGIRTDRPEYQDILDLLAATFHHR